MEVPVYLFTGFLEAGKTSFIAETMKDPNFNDGKRKYLIILCEDGVEGLETVVTSKNTYVAPFVNAEKTEYLVIEDSFPNGRPSALEKGGLIFTTRETVDKVEKM